MPLYDPTDPWLNRHDPRIACPTAIGKTYYLRGNEHLIFAEYFDNYDLTPLGEAIRENKDVSDDFRHFIADVLSGLYKRPPKMKNKTTVRDFEIHYQINVLMAVDPTLKRKTNRKQSGAAGIVAEKLRLTGEEVALNAYKRIETHLKKRLYMDSKVFLLD